MGDFTIFLVLVWSVGILISLTLELTFPGAVEAGIMTQAMRLEIFQYTNLPQMIWGGIKLALETPIILMNMLSWNFIFFTGNWLWARWIMCCVSVGYAMVLLVAFFGRR